MKIILIGGFAALVLTGVAASQAATEGQRFEAPLAPLVGILPADSPARGKATFQLGINGKTVDFEVTASGIAGVTQVHIHVGEAATTVDGAHYHLPPKVGNGPIAVFLLDYVPAGVSTDGILVKGTFTAADLRGPFKGQSMATFIDHMNQGATYVNIHADRNIGEGCCPSCLQGVIRPR